MPDALAQSYDYCTALARRTGRNFYFSFLTLPRPLFRDMCVLYAFMRQTDDLGDRDDVPVPERVLLLQSWRAQLRAALAGEPAHGDVLPALVDIVRRHAIPSRYLEEVISGVESDLTPRRLLTFDELRDYCYQVAGAVGLCCIHIWGFDDAAAVPRAIDCGLAFQLTNILRDLREDSAMERVYLPVEDLQRFDYTPDDLAAGVCDDRFRELMKFQVARARHYYRLAAELQPLLRPAGRPILTAMFRIYAGLLREIERRRYDVFSHRIRLSRLRKYYITADSLLRQSRPLTAWT